MSSLKINFHKSRFGRLVGVKEETMGRFTRYLNCKVLQFLFVYLEIPIGVNLGECRLGAPSLTKYQRNSSFGSTNI